MRQKDGLHAIILPLALGDLNLLQKSHLNYPVNGNIQICHLVPSIFSDPQEDVKQRLPEEVRPILHPHMLFPNHE